MSRYRWDYVLITSLNTMEMDMGDNALEVIRQAPGIGQSEIKLILGEKGATVGKCLRRLVHEGHIRLHTRGRRATYTVVDDTAEEQLDKDVLRILYEFIRYYGQLRKEVPKYGHQLKLLVNDIIYAYFTGLPARMEEHVYYSPYRMILVQNKLSRVRDCLREEYGKCDDAPEIKSSIEDLLRLVRNMSQKSRSLVGNIIETKERHRDIKNKAEKGRTSQNLKKLVDEMKTQNNCIARIEQDLLFTDRTRLAKTVVDVKESLKKYEAGPTQHTRTSEPKKGRAGAGRAARKLDKLDLKIIRLIEQNPGVSEVELIGKLGEHPKNTVIRRCRYLAEHKEIRRHKNKGVTYAATKCDLGEEQTKLMHYYIDETLKFLNAKRGEVAGLPYYAKKDLVDDINRGELLDKIRDSIKKEVDHSKIMRKSNYEGIDKDVGAAYGALKGGEHVLGEHHQVLLDVVAGIEKRLHCILDDIYKYAESSHATADCDEKKAIEEKHNRALATELDLNRDLEQIQSKAASHAVDDALVDLMRRRHILRNSTEFEDVIRIVDEGVPAGTRDELLSCMWKIRDDLHERWHSKRHMPLLATREAGALQRQQKEYQERYDKALAMWDEFVNVLVSHTGSEIDRL